MHHLLAYSAAALDASAGDVQLAAVAEQIYNRSNNSFQIPQPHVCLAAHAGGVGMTRARFRQGSLISRGFPQIASLAATTQAPTAQQIADFRDYPIQLRPEEDLRVDVTNGAANDAVALLWVTPFQITRNINARDVRVIRFTAAPTTIVSSWSVPVTITFQDTLEGGVYDIYGMVCSGTGVVASRLVLQNQILRPGSLSYSAMTIITDRDMFYGGMGKWGEFNTYSVPQIETLGNAAAAITLEGRLMVAKRGS